MMEMNAKPTRQAEGQASYAILPKDNQLCLIPWSTTVKKGKQRTSVYREYNQMMETVKELHLLLC